MDHDCEFFVPGIPVPKGSAKGFYIKSIQRVVITQDNEKKQKPWASMIAVLARKAGVMFIQDGPVIIDLVFYFQRPKGHFRTNGELRPTAPVHKTTKPDEDKLRRCVMDALTGIAYHDDSQVIGGSQFKYFIGAKDCASYERNPGCRVMITYPRG
jgi:Holliday junction resolvase RusA-like endonuclease